MFDDGVEDTCQTLGTVGVTIVRVSVDQWCSEVHVRFLLLLV